MSWMGEAADYPPNFKDMCTHLRCRLLHVLHAAEEPQQDKGLVGCCTSTSQAPQAHGQLLAAHGGQHITGSTAETRQPSGRHLRAQDIQTPAVSDPSGMLGLSWSMCSGAVTTASIYQHAQPHAPNYAKTAQQP